MIGAPVDKAIQSPPRRAVLLRSRGLPRRLAAYIVIRIVLEIVFLLLLIEGVFLAEKFNGILENAILARMSSSQIVLVLGYTAPEIFNLALPAALLIAIYRTVVRLRENRELLVVVSAGVGVRPLVALLISMAIPAQFLSLLVSGYINPNAQFTQRSIVFQATYERLRKGAAFGEFHFSDNYTAFAQPPEADMVAPSLFLHHILDANTDRLIIAKHWQLVEQQDGWFKLLLRDFTVNDYFSARGFKYLDQLPPDSKTNIQMTEMRIGDFQQELSIDHLIYFAPRGVFLSERILPELIYQGDFIDVARVITRSVLCLFAPLIALLAVAFTHQTSRIFVPPIAIALLMSIDISVVFVVKRFTHASPIFTGAGLGIAAVATLLVLGRMIVLRQHGLLRPELGES